LSAPGESSATVGLVRAVFAAWERGDYSSVAWASPEIEFSVVDGPSPGAFTGVTGMIGGYRELMNAWEDYRPAAAEYRELDKDRVLVLFDLSGRGKASGVELRQVRPKAAGVFQVRGGKISSIALYWERERALADLGLGPESDGETPTRRV
jgi:ketosteroid isomerase-like protein